MHRPWCDCPQVGHEAVGGAEGGGAPAAAEDLPLGDGGAGAGERDGAAVEAQHSILKWGADEIGGMIMMFPDIYQGTRVDLALWGSGGAEMNFIFSGYEPAWRAVFARTPPIR